MKAYLRNWSLYIRGFRWLWTREVDVRGTLVRGTFDGFGDPALSTIRYKPGWGPWTFLLPYCTTYLGGVLIGAGVVSLSRWWAVRAEEGHRFSRFITRKLDDWFPGKTHGAEAGGWLWGSEDLWR